MWFWDVDKGMSKIAKRTEAKEDLSDNAMKLVSSTLRGAYAPPAKSNVPEAFSSRDLNLIFKND